MDAMMCHVQNKTDRIRRITAGRLRGQMREKTTKELIKIERLVTIP